ncbi:transient receptor potential cation channel subfamily V member 5-like [Antedon mediterranea]|uniref:transient receptor potential cation channel subfamily V member 5-like n=1 Tax=Antedon mediterranea TaxID=105859 RepID=UPI003AF62034
MGVTGSSQKDEDDSGTKQQIDENSTEIYSLVNSKGGGRLVTLAKKAIGTGKWDEFEDTIRSPLVRAYLYVGENKKIPIKTLIEIRHNTCSRKRDKLITGEKTTIGGLYREQCWDVDKRGSVGETILHLCFLNKTKIHMELAMRLVTAYPTLINDIYTNDMYYGETCLHMAIANDNFKMVQFLVEHNADINARCCGHFFSTEDQLKTRYDTYDHEHVQIALKTDYDGAKYWGEYPLSFAASLGFTDIFRYLHAKGGDMNAQDSNGNTALHIAVIHNQLEILTIAFELGGNLAVQNRRGFSCLSLAAYLVRPVLFEHILNLERELEWNFGTVTCAAYNLNNIDSINMDGTLNSKSAIYTIAYKSGMDRLPMLKGLVFHIIEQKWKTFAKVHFIFRLVAYIIYLLCFCTSFYLRAGKASQEFAQDGTMNNETVQDRCYILQADTGKDVVRIVCETFSYIGCVFYLLFGLIEVRQHGKDAKMFLLKAPARCLFLFSCFLVLLSLFGRIPPCAPHYEDSLLIVAVLTSVPYFMFFLRAFPLVGKFVFIFYKMLFGDLLTFLAIFVVFVMGFSQAMHVIFVSYEPKPGDRDYHILHSIVGIFIMSLGEFEDIYDKFEQTQHHIIAKLLFAVYMIIVSLLLINMLIAMMASTFIKIDEAKNEYQRQWAQIVLVIEQGLSLRARRLLQNKYSTPMWNGQEGRAIVMRSENEGHDESLYVNSKFLHTKNTHLEYNGDKWVINTVEDDAQSTVSVSSTPAGLSADDDEQQHFPDFPSYKDPFGSHGGIINQAYMQ